MALGVSVSGFTLPSIDSTHRRDATTASTTTTSTTLFMVGQQQQQQEGGGEQRVAEGTHEELMYALGVNLARQLGDVRPRTYAFWLCYFLFNEPVTVLCNLWLLRTGYVQFFFVFHLTHSIFIVWFDCE